MIRRSIKCTIAMPSKFPTIGFTTTSSSTNTSCYHNDFIASSKLSSSSTIPNKGRREIHHIRKAHTGSSRRYHRVTTRLTAATAILTCLGNTSFTSSFSLNMSSSFSTEKETRHPLAKLSENFDHSWIAQLNPETEENRRLSKQKTPQDDGVSNNVKRPVYNGHYVPVRPDPLINPRLVIHSPDMAQELDLSLEDVDSEAFVKFFSGDVDGAFHGGDGDDDDTDTGNSNGAHKVKTWATPYALSIMGQRYTSNCPFGTGDGYGDGRAISIGEVAVAKTSHPHASPRYELQLKGAGPTPFCRGADGRAVLRSSIREFLASEAMHNLGIETTRALSLIVSQDGNTSSRPWYSDRNKKSIPDIDDPRLSKYSLEQRKQIIAQLNAQSRNDPDVMIEEPNAITCRVAPSFVRIGHLDLFARRATKGILDDNSKADSSTQEFKELEGLVWHACFREFPAQCYEPFKGGNDILSASKCLLEHSLDGISSMVAGWIRVGFAQGNFNADNCLVAGRTMDYGPFGFMDEYHPLFAKWTGSGDHFGFMNQVNAGFANYVMLVSSVMPVIEANSESMDEANKFKDELIERAQGVFEDKLMEALRSKLGFHPGDEIADDIWGDLELLLRESRADWTMFWRQLTTVVNEFPVNGEGVNPSVDYGDMLDMLITNDKVKEGSSPFYAPLDMETRDKFLEWIQTWRECLVESYKDDGASFILSKDDNSYTAPLERMRFANPKYILREWMLVEAYSKASPSSILSPLFPISINSSEADESMVQELFSLIQNPYDEGTDKQDRKYFRRAPDEALEAGGTAFMS